MQFVIAVCQFAPASEKAINESKVIRDRIIQGLRARQRRYGIRVIIKELKETIDPSSNNGLESAKILGRHYGAHMVLCGKIRLDEEYYFEPAIINLMPFREKNLIKFDSTGNPLTFSMGLSENRRLQLKKQKVAQIADFASFIFGLSKYQSKNFQQARSIFESMETQTIESLLYRGNCDINLKEYDASILLFDQALDLNPKYLEAWFAKGSVYFLTEDYDKADKILSVATTIKAEGDLSTLALVWAQRGLTLTAKDKLEQAIDMFDKAISLQPDQATAWAGKSVALFLQGLKIMCNAVDVFWRGDNPTPQLNAVTNIAEKAYSKFTEATKACNKGIMLNPKESSFWLLKGHFLLCRWGLEDEALASFDKAIELEPELIEAWRGKALTFAALGRYKEANDIAERWSGPDKQKLLADMQRFNTLRNSVQAKRPGIVHAQESVFKGRSLAIIGEWDKAASVFSDVITIKPDYAEAWLGLASVYYLQGKVALSFEKCKRAIAIKPDYAQAWRFIGFHLMLRGKLNDSLSAYAEAIRIKPDYAWAWEEQGYTLLLMKKYDMALAAYEEAVRLKTDYAEAFFGKYMTLNALGRHKEAVAAYNKAIEINPDLAWADYGVP
jgi:tetratricopeptide (TPR) repeat protein